jgi:hypothetical protein
MIIMLAQRKGCELVEEWTFQWTALQIDVTGLLLATMYLDWMFEVFIITV